MSKIVKNKGRNDEYEKTGAYVPEYIRLGKSPTAVYEKEVKKDFEMLPFKKKKKKNDSSSYLEEEEERIFSLENDKRTSSPVLDEEIMFPPGLFSKKGIPAPKHDDNQRSKIDLYYDENSISNTEQESSDEEEDSNDNLEDDSFLKDLKDGDFALTYQGDVCFISKDIKKIEFVVESLIKEGFEGEEVSLSDIKLIKVIPLKIGVCVMV